MQASRPLDGTPFEGGCRSQRLQKVPLPGGDYTMDHSVAIYVLYKRARVRLMFTMNRRLEDVAHDILELLREAS